MNFLEIVRQDLDVDPSIPPLLREMVLQKAAQMKVRRISGGSEERGSMVDYGRQDAGEQLDFIH